MSSTPTLHPIRRRQRRSHGFTLMEVLLVLVIVVMLGGTASLFFINIQTNAYKDAARNQINQFKQALDLYRMDVGMYPTDQQGLSVLHSAPTDLSNPAKWRGPYMKDEIPADPWENPYKYVKVSESEIEIISFGPDRVEGTEDDVRG
jgi:general secretion pathway protein G